jgi:hypothetical protein
MGKLLFAASGIYQACGILVGEVEQPPHGSTLALAGMCGRLSMIGGRPKTGYDAAASR